MKIAATPRSRLRPGPVFSRNAPARLGVSISAAIVAAALVLGACSYAHGQNSDAPDSTAAPAVEAAPDDADAPTPATDDSPRRQRSQGRFASIKPKLYKFVKPVGAVALALIALTVCLGFLRRVKALRTRVVMRIHKTTGVCALIVAAIHATIVIILHS